MTSERKIQLTFAFKTSAEKDTIAQTLQAVGGISGVSSTLQLFPNDNDSELARMYMAYAEPSADAAAIAAQINTLPGIKYAQKCPARSIPSPRRS